MADLSEILSLKERVKDIQTSYRHLVNQAQRVEGQLESLEKKKESLEKRIEFLTSEQEILVLVSQLFKSFLDEEISEDLKSIVDLQTEGLQEIFYDQNYCARAETHEQRGKISVDIQTVSRLKELGDIEGDVTSSFGGSIAAIQGILLRISVIYRRGLRPVLILDETLKFVENKYVDKAVRFLQFLCDKMGLDIILITHDHDVISAAKTAYRISYSEGKAEFSKIK